jgi:2'-5' RNA ligase
MSVRCFVAVDIEDSELLEAFEKAQAVFKSTGADLKSVETGNMHITLRFLGDVPDGEVEGVGDVIRRLEFEPFSLDVNGVGVFPSLSRPSVVWAGLEGERLPEMLRIYNREQLAETVRELADEHFGELEVRHVRLKKSVLTSRGPIYSTLAESKSI